MQMSQTADLYDDLTADEIARLREAGASPEFIQMAQYTDGTRSSIRDNADRFLNGHVDPEGGLSEMAFGHFGKYMWEGNISKAFERADGRNTRILVELFGLAYINGDATERGNRQFKEEEETGRYIWA